MSNKIDSSIGAAGAPAPVRPVVARGRDSCSTSSSPQQKSDSVALTGEAQVLQTVQNRARSDSGVDAAKVADVRRALSEGRYTADPGAIAGKLLGAERDLK